MLSAEEQLVFTDELNFFYKKNYPQNVQTSWMMMSSQQGNFLLGSLPLKIPAMNIRTATNNQMQVLNVADIFLGLS